MKVFKSIVFLFLLFFVFSKFFVNSKPNENGLTKKEQNIIKKAVVGDGDFFVQLVKRELTELERNISIVDGDVVVTGRGFENVGDGKEEFIFNIRFSKKNNVYSRQLTTNSYPKSDFVCSLNLSRLVRYGSHTYTESTDEKVLNIMKDFNYGYLIKVERTLHNLKIYFDDGSTPEETINNYSVFFETDENDRKVRSFTVNGLIGEYNDLTEAANDIKNSPIPIELVSKKKYSKKSRLTNENSKEIVSSFYTENYYVRVVKQSSIFYKALIWNKNNLTEKPDVIFSNGKKDSNYSTYVFEQNNKVVTIVKDSMLEIVDRFDTEKSIKERAVD